MKLAGRLLLPVCLALNAAPSWAQQAGPDSAAEAEVPAPFMDCVAAQRREMRDPESEREFDCTRVYFESLPGSEGSPQDMAAAANQAAEAADLYIDSHLLPAIFDSRQPEAESGAPSFARNLLVKSYVRSARAAGETLCDLLYERHSGGTIRSVIAGSCAIGNRDELIQNLLGFDDQAPGE